MIKSEETRWISSQKPDVTSHLGKKGWQGEDEVLIGALDILAKVEHGFCQILQNIATGRVPI